MRVLDEKKGCQVSGEKASFGNLRPGTVFVYSGRALMKVATLWRPYMQSEPTRNTPPMLSWEKVNAVRLGHLSDPCHPRDGWFSSFSDETEVIICPQAAIYLKG